MKYPMLGIQYRWGDLDLHKEPQIGPHGNLWIAIMQRAWDDLTWASERGEEEMKFLLEAHEFFTIENAAFELCCQVMKFAESQIDELRAFAEMTFRENYVQPTPAVWKKKGRKPRGYIDIIS